MYRKPRKKRAIKKRVYKKFTLSQMKACIQAANTKSDLFEELGFLNHYHSVKSSSNFKIICVQYSECPLQLFSWMMDLLEQNMAEMYAACDWGWDINEKRDEMSESAARFIIALTENDKPVAFSHFRFDIDNYVCVIYCYELQVDKSAQKQGLAKHILKTLESLCQHYNMTKVVLTVFNHNLQALNFFKSQGYQHDETTPQNYGVETCYSILSKLNQK